MLVLARSSKNARPLLLGDVDGGEEGFLGHSRVERLIFERNIASNAQISLAGLLPDARESLTEASAASMCPRSDWASAIRALKNDRKFNQWMRGVGRGKGQRHIASSGSQS